MVQKHKNQQDQQNQELIQVQALAVRVMEEKVETTMVEIAVMTMDNGDSGGNSDGEESDSDN